MTHRFSTSESVAPGHPDKTSDQIGDAILDAIFEQDKNAKVDCEVLIMQGTVIVTGQITTKAHVEIPDIVRGVLKDIGFDNARDGLDWKTCGIVTSFGQQSPDIAMGVNKASLKKQGAGDQGCLKIGTLVRTRGGFLPIEDVKPGDFVATIDGFKEVLATQKTGNRRLCLIRLDNGMGIECTPGHRFLCYDRRGQLYWRRASSLSRKDYICALKPTETSATEPAKSFVPHSLFFTKYNHKIYGPEKLALDEKTGYLMGVLVGDGCVTSKYSLDFTFGDNEKHMRTVKGIADAVFPGQCRVCRAKDGNFALQISSIVVRKHFENFGMEYHKAPKKTTPKTILASPPSVIRSYLRGLYDSDGTIVESTGRKKESLKLRLGSTSRRLLQETQLLLEDMGIRAAVRFNAKKGLPVGKTGKNGKQYFSKHDSYTLNLVGYQSYRRFEELVGFLDEEKNRRLKRYVQGHPVKPRNSRGLYMVPNPYKDQLNSEEYRRKNLPFAVVRYAYRRAGSRSDVYDIQTKGLSMFNGNGIFVHNSMIGYATNETKEMIPLPAVLAHKITRRLFEARKSGLIPWLRPDGKSQVTVEYDENKPVRVDTVVVAAQHTETVSTKQVKREIIDKVIKPVIPTSLLDGKTRFLVNATGRFVIGGALADSGVLGRKIVVDSYGADVPTGGGCYSGKDPSKVDRSGAYMTRYIAKNIVAAKLADRCEIQVAYAIGIPEPVSVCVDTFGTGKVPDDVLLKAIRKAFDLRPGMIIKQLDLLRPIYRKTACFGHFGRDDKKTFSWERTDKTKLLRGLLGV